MEKIAVVGSGVMGAGIAAHCANAGMQVVLLDIPDNSSDDRSSIAKGAIERQLKFGGFMSPEFAKYVEPGNLDDDFDKLSEVDWIIEAVVEDLKIKRELYQRINQIRRNDTIVSSNTSTIPLINLVEGLPEVFTRNFVITHFFNPPRHMRLLELVGGPSTDPDVLKTIEQCCEQILGKGVVHCKDTPGFIANRIGIYWMLTGVYEAMAEGISVTEADALISKPVGIPKTGVFGLWDLVGIDLWPKLVDSMLPLISEKDAYHSVAAMPDLISNMIVDGYTGRKGKGGFYRLVKDGDKRLKQRINLATGEYESISASSLESLDKSKEGLKSLLVHPDQGGRYTWRVLSKTLNYAASLVNEIADDYQSIDEAMRNGFAWKSGPFQLLDQIGPAWFAEQLRKEGQVVAEVLSSVGKDSFYRETEGELQIRNLEGTYQKIRRASGVVLLEDIKRQSSKLTGNAAASLWDIGHGVTCLELHTKMNALQPDSMEMIEEALKVTGRDYKAMIIYNEGSVFSAGANLSQFHQWLEEGSVENVIKFIEYGQQVYSAIKFSAFPVVAATSGFAFGGGCELALHCDAIQAYAETYAGLVEKNVGVVPAWGGCKEMILRHRDNIPRAFQLIATSKVSSSAADARDMGILRDGDGITMNRDRLMVDAKTKALKLSEGYRAPEPAKINSSINGALIEWISEESEKGILTKHDQYICEILSNVFKNGETSETGFLENEKHAFMHLIDTSESLARIEHFLNTGKPLRN